MHTWKMASTTFQLCTISCQTLFPLRYHRLLHFDNLTPEGAQPWECQEELPNNIQQHAPGCTPDLMHLGLGSGGCCTETSGQVCLTRMWIFAPTEITDMWKPVVTLLFPKVPKSENGPGGTRTWREISIKYILFIQQNYIKKTLLSPRWHLLVSSRINNKNYTYTQKTQITQQNLKKS